MFPIAYSTHADQRFQMSVPIYRLEERRQKTLAGVETALKRREGDPVQADLDEALKRIGCAGGPQRPLSPAQVGKPLDSSGGLEVLTS